MKATKVLLVLVLVAVAVLAGTVRYIHSRNSAKQVAEAAVTASRQAREALALEKAEQRASEIKAQAAAEAAGGAVDRAHETRGR